MSFTFSSSNQKGGGTQTIALPEPSPQEKKLRDLNLKIAQMQLAQFEAATKQSAEEAASPLTAKKQQLESAAIDNLLARINGTAPVISPEAQQRLDTIYGNTLGQGEQDILRFGRDMAASRGMALTDSPIGGEVTQRQADLVQRLGAAKAGSALDYGNTDALFQQASAQFAQQLQDRAFQNRMAMATMTPAPYGLQQSLFGERLAAAPRSMTQFGSGTGYGYGLSGNDIAGYGKGYTSFRNPSGGGGVA